jgi:glyoxylase-like metal-dependent hydrolase (beta-lactamase superfamily II)
MVSGAGGNIAVQVGDDGVLMVDTGLEAPGERVMEAVRRLSSKPIRYIVNTSARPDHTGGNERFAKAGIKAGGGLLVGGFAGDGAMVIAHDAGADQGRTPDAGLRWTLRRPGCVD